MARRKYIRRKTKKKKEVVELVTKCDQCGKLLCRTCARTSMSGIIAGGCGVSVMFVNGHINKRPIDKVMFFCCLECLGGFNEGKHSIQLACT